MEFSGLLINAFRRRVFFLVFVLYYFWLKMQKFLQSKFIFLHFILKTAMTQKVSAVQTQFFKNNLFIVYINYTFLLDFRIKFIFNGFYIVFYMKSFKNKFKF